MRISEFSYLASIYGGDIDIWPLDRQEAARTLMLTNATAQTTIIEAAETDLLIRGVVKISPDQEVTLNLLADGLSEKVFRKKEARRKQEIQIKASFLDKENFLLSYIAGIETNQSFKYIFATLCLISSLSGGILGSIERSSGGDNISDIICSTVIYEDLFK